MSYDKPLSYSGLKTYQSCPKKWEYTYIHGVRSPSGAAAQRGTNLHAQLENFFLLGIAPLDPALKSWMPVMEKLAEHAPKAELQLAVTEEWEPCDFADPSAYFRGAIDLTFRTDEGLYIIDFKSGREYPDHIDQGKAYMTLFHEYAPKYFLSFIYLDKGDIVEREFTPKDRDDVIDQVLRPLIAEVRAAEEFPAKPGAVCRYCPANWRNGGRCSDAP